MTGTTSNTSISLPGNLEILIVDDDRIIHILHRKTVELFQAGIPISVHENGKQALEYIRQKKNVNFLVLLDLNMPVMNGWEFLEECQYGEPEKLYTVIVTSSTNSADRLRCFDYPQVIAYCEKPLTRDKMREILELKELKPFTNPKEGK